MNYLRALLLLHISIFTNQMSSNAFATGTNQNCGNVITDRSTTRIHAPPGGTSSFSIGGGAFACARTEKIDSLLLRGENDADG